MLQLLKKQSFYLALIILLSACETALSDKKTTPVQITKEDSIINHTQNNNAKDTADNDYATYFVVVADTSSDYFLLRKKMFYINKQTGIPIDTAGRFYNKVKNLIALPDNDADEIYAGDYLPRRFPSNNLSLEYLGLYQKQAKEKTIALVTGIYETEKRADSVLVILQKIEKKTFKIKSNMYIGCIH